jgi:hypothetical protein
MYHVTISQSEHTLLCNSFLAKNSPPSNDDFPLFKEENPLNTIDHEITCVHTNPILSQI